MVVDKIIAAIQRTNEHSVSSVVSDMAHKMF